jgi:hypothetical protein
MSIEIFDRNNEWIINIMNEKWKFDDLQTMIKIIEKLEHDLNFIVEYHSGMHNIKMYPKTCYISINDSIYVKTRKELNDILKILLDAKMDYGRWKSCR